MGSPSTIIIVPALLPELLPLLPGTTPRKLPSVDNCPLLLLLNNVGRILAGRPVVDALVLPREACTEGDWSPACRVAVEPEPKGDSCGETVRSPPLPPPPAILLALPIVLLEQLLLPLLSLHPRRGERDCLLCNAAETTGLPPAESSDGSLAMSTPSTTTPGRAIRSLEVDPVKAALLTGVSGMMEVERVRSEFATAWSLAVDEAEGSIE